MVLYVLNRVIYRKQEMERNEIPFLCHSSTDYAKILWKKGEAVGFYSVKPTGELYKLLKPCYRNLHFDPQLCQCLKLTTRMQIEMLALKISWECHSCTIQQRGLLGKSFE